MIYRLLQNRTKTLYFARDPLGRRSLLIHAPSRNEPTLYLASVSCGFKKDLEFDELSTEGIFRMRLDEWVSGLLNPCFAPRLMFCDFPCSSLEGRNGLSPANRSYLSVQKILPSDQQINSRAHPDARSR